MNVKLEFEKQDEYQIRLKKLTELRQLGIEPYPPKFTPRDTAQKLRDDFEPNLQATADDAAQGRSEPVCVAGRLVLFRAMGKNAFGHLQDHSGRIQIMFNKQATRLTGYPDDATPPPLKIIEKKIDLGDIIGVEGRLFRTKKGELTIFAEEVTLLCKSLLPLPEKHSGLCDKETRYRKRWLDLICNEEVKQTFIQRNIIIRYIRNFFEERGFLEVETPVLQNIYGGAEARPFTTRLNALDQKMFMRISLEISLKKLIIGGMHRIFEIGKVFRNEGIDRSHNPEFTLLEAYAAYWDYNDLMILMENLVERLALKLRGSTKLKIHPGNEEPREIDLKAPWKRLTMRQSLIEYADIDVDKLSDQELYDKVIACGHLESKKVQTFSRGLIIAALFEHLVEPKLIQPHHITDFPIETTPLCKPHRQEKERKKGIVERFESFILGSEFCNAYSELNDPLIQKRLLEEQAKKLRAGEAEANPFDHEFIEAISQGMPPVAGIGIGLDRLIIMLTDSPSIRDVLLFPWMKPNR